MKKINQSEKACDYTIGARRNMLSIDTSTNSVIASFFRLINFFHKFFLLLALIKTIGRRPLQITGKLVSKNLVNLHMF
ncbi:hypothetical protein ACC45_07010 [Francisella tularensis subsp. holarctica]|nr:hypothetical protein ACC45_07010 [Francisella tularensis subsp. holarctica]